MDATRSFNGHAIGRADRRFLCTTETDVDTGAGLIARRDARSLETVDKWATHGIDAHELIWSPRCQGRQAVAPILALFDGKALRLCPVGQSRAGHGSSIASTAEGWAVNCLRSKGVATFTPEGQWRGLVGLEEVCALAPRRALHKPTCACARTRQGTGRRAHGQPLGDLRLRRVRAFRRSAPFVSPGP